ncbi:glycogen debranching protein GlgX [Desulfurivibrio sp. D14AmB]|uniref:glycogen debranching protein GlgX n=1 Tax=Desulfurivibrio sp. D14AmB TaxID=3374370 RepID=UPI00376EC7FE
MSKGRISVRTAAGSPLPMGVSRTPSGHNFAIAARHATAVSLVLFRSGQDEPVAEVEFDPRLNRTGDVWHLLVRDFDPALRYGFRLRGPCDLQGSGHCYRPQLIMLDPYAKALTGGSDWGVAYRRSGRPDPLASFQRRCVHVESDFDWEGDRPLNIPLKDTIIYELHPRGYTAHSSSGVKHPGTYRGLIAKIPYLKKLGVTAVELLPVAEFNELENTRVNPATGEPLKNFWGYSPLAFFAPKAAYAVNGRDGNQVREFKELVKALHTAGIEVILDVVFNHTAEGGADGPTISLRGIDNAIYYLLDPVTRQYLNFSGCGNTVNCNHPWVRDLIMDCLRYWVTEMHVDGFRFDLASILGRGPRGEVLADPPMVEKIAEDPVLAHTKIIAEAWDAAGLYQVGSFSPHPRWAEWNGRFRDDLRRFLCGHPDCVGPLATRIAGSSDLYGHNGRMPFNSINFITSHDGFTLYDLVSYSRKHNEANGEENRDGDNHNISWNSGVEGETDDPEIIALRRRRIRTAAVILLLSQGVPMICAGDEFGRSQQGNNNAYCQDNEISWVDWGLEKRNADLIRFFRLLIALRKDYPIFRRAGFFNPDAGDGRPEISWQSLVPGRQDWSPEARCLAFRLHGGEGPDFLVLLNAASSPRRFLLPDPLPGRRWRLLLNTAAAAPADIVPVAKAKVVSGSRLEVADYGAVVLICRQG